MNSRKRKQEEYVKRKEQKKMYTPEGYLKDPPDSKCPYCGKSGKSCSYVNSLSRAWARGACAKKHNNVPLD
jgi:prepilin signal peptidase PulO-like enzyme (type II secretory pathway)